MSFEIFASDAPSTSADNPQELTTDSAEYKTSISSTFRPETSKARDLGEISATGTSEGDLKTWISLSPADGHKSPATAPPEPVLSDSSVENTAQTSTESTITVKQHEEISIIGSSEVDLKTWKTLSPVDVHESPSTTSPQPVSPDSPMESTSTESKSTTKNYEEISITSAPEGVTEHLQTLSSLGYHGSATSNNLHEVFSASTSVGHLLNTRSSVKTSIKILEEFSTPSVKDDFKSFETPTAILGSSNSEAMINDERTLSLKSERTLALDSTADDQLFTNTTSSVSEVLSETLGNTNESLVTEFEQGYVSAESMTANVGSLNDSDPFDEQTVNSSETTSRNTAGMTSPELSSTVLPSTTSDARTVLTSTPPLSLKLSSQSSASEKVTRITSPLTGNSALPTMTIDNAVKSLCCCKCCPTAWPFVPCQQCSASTLAEASKCASGNISATVLPSSKQSFKASTSSAGEHVTSATLKYQNLGVLDGRDSLSASTLASSVSESKVVDYAGQQEDAYDSFASKHSPAIPQFPDGFEDWTISEKTRYGFTLDDLLLDCQFSGANCHPR